jgi:hypothetical protein
MIGIIGLRGFFGILFWIAVDDEISFRNFYLPEIQWLLMTIHVGLFILIPIFDVVFDVGENSVVFFLFTNYPVMKPRLPDGYARGLPVFIDFFCCG